ncbi:MAG: dihydroorotase [Candidatus Moranbacteria bacterium]|nr:dihydroorotase [Candidatus Moranbacteria bacterium]
MQGLTFTRPDDWHLHLRDGEAMASVLGFSLAQFGRLLIMPNLKPPVTTTALALAYRTRIIKVAQQTERRHSVDLLMTLYLTSNTSPDEIRRAKDAGITACKLYPAGATTNSAAGVGDIREIYPVLAVMQEVGMVLCVHGEVTDPAVDIFDREAVFIERVMIPLRRDFPGLKVVFEHITTKEGVDYVWDGGRGIAATITAHHLLYNRNALFMGGLRPHYYCLPVLKSEQHRQALVRAATSGNPKYFLGTDSAPHAVTMKEQSVCGAGCFTAPTALELYAMAFEATGKLDMLEGFASFFGADFYGLPRNTGTVTLARVPWQVQKELPFGDATIKPFMGGMTIPWRLTA